MLKFQRTKLVDIIDHGDGTIAVHGTLDDHIYQIEVDLVIDTTDLTIRAIDGKWIRAENTQCQRAIAFLQRACGIAIDAADFSQRINKQVGRKSCPHFANLIIECCEAAKDAIEVLRFERAQKEQPDLTFQQHLAGRQTVPATPAAPKNNVPAVPQPHIAAGKKHKADSGGFTIDLHTHSFPASPCSSASADDLVAEAKRTGLDAVCITDHNHVWGQSAIETLSQTHGILVLRGNEITTDQGDMIVFGMDDDVQGIITLQRLKRMVDAAGGFIIAAHPFRGFLVFNTSQIGMTVEKAIQRPALQQVHALEVLNGKVTAAENDFADKVAAGLGLPATGGSDAHDIDELGKYATCFESPISSEKELVLALKSGAYAPCRFRTQKDEAPR